MPYTKQDLQNPTTFLVMKLTKPHPVAGLNSEQESYSDEDPAGLLDVIRSYQLRTGDYDMAAELFNQQTFSTTRGRNQTQKPREQQQLRKMKNSEENDVDQSERLEHLRTGIVA